MARKIKIEDFHNIEVQFPNLNKIVLKHSVQTANDLRRNKWQKWKEKRAKPRYNSGWYIEMTEDKKNRTVGTVYNRRQWQLTWLLENGHFIVNKKNGVGWAYPHPHISEAFKENAPKYIRDMETHLDIKVEMK